MKKAARLSGLCCDEVDGIDGLEAAVEEGGFDGDADEDEGEDAEDAEKGHALRREWMRARRFRARDM